MSPIGQRLRNERENKGASRVDVSQETKIAVHHIAALEYSDFAELPDTVHVKGYVRAYAEYLGLEPAEVLEEFLEEYRSGQSQDAEDPRDEVVRKMSSMLGDSAKSETSGLRTVVIVAALAVVVALIWMGWRWFTPPGRSGGETATELAVSGSPAIDEHGLQPASGEANASSATDDPPTQASVEHQDPTPQQFVVIREPEPEKTTPPPRTEAPVENRETTSQQSTVIREPEREETPPPPPVEARAPVTPASGSRLSISQYGVGTAVENRRLRGESDRFALGTKVAFFTRVEGGRRGDTIRHVWRHEGQAIISIPLSIGGANWRTHSRKTMWAGSVGSWTVEAIDEAGNVLARSEFSCLP